jgi:hypothetical protein
MRLQPQHTGRRRRIDSKLAPPVGFVAAAVDLAMVSAAARDRELVADFAAKGATLGKAQVVRVRRDATANEARLLGHLPDVFTVAHAAGLGDCQNALVDTLRFSRWLGPPPLSSRSLAWAV